MKYYSLRRKERITKKEEFDKIIQKGHKIVKKVLLVYFVEKERSFSRAGFLVGRRIGGAVVRNKVKRLFKEVYRLNKYSIQGDFDLLIQARSNVRNSSFREIERSLLEACREYYGRLRS